MHWLLGLFPRAWRWLCVRGRRTEVIDFRDEPRTLPATPSGNLLIHPRRRKDRR